MDYSYSVMYSQDERGVWTACVPELKNLASEGDTIEEAQKMIEEAIALYLECLEEDHMPIPDSSRGRRTLLGTVTVTVARNVA
ncbi:MAG: type II toxin-antitoxin system HicB family antitoxin [Calditrichaeota bacterium]|nr:type II toxin-antitoxin system HicB family antitoxin [Calditrichota bacterium]MCB9365824.1 type II toxin-antitoxin system HicB family antitoxin [Calditrichota bacterium]